MNTRFQRNALKRTGELGFSLIEMLTASLLLGTMLLGVGMVYPRGMSSITSSGERAKAGSIAQEKIEELLEAASSGEADDRLFEGTYEDLPDPGFTRRWSITRDRIERSVADVTVTVTWKHRNTDRSVTIRTLVALKEKDS